MQRKKCATHIVNLTKNSGGRLTKKPPAENIYTSKATKH